MNNIEVSYHFQQAPEAIGLFIFAHGAGADKTHPFLDNVSELLINKGISVFRFNFPYMDKRAKEQKKYPPDRFEKLQMCYQKIYESISGQLDPSLPIFIGGKSMGGRVAASLANQPLTKLCGVICFGYPFHPIKKPEKLRLLPLQESTYPVLILQGERDALGNREEIASYSLPSQCQLTFLPDGDHDLKPRVKSGYTHQQNITVAIDAMLRFIDENR